MSFNIINTRILSGSPTINAAIAFKLADTFEHQLPEKCFLYSLKREAIQIIKENPDTFSQTDLPIKDLTWSGVFSGNSIEVFRKIIPNIKGDFDVVFTWEDGSHSGFRYENGKVIGCTVELRLNPCVP
jgi:hypothetical protein